jgi:hypothetical protein
MQRRVVYLVFCSESDTSDVIRVQLGSFNSFNATKVLHGFRKDMPKADLGDA